MPKTKNKPATHKPKRPAAQELDGVYLLKLALYVILGSMWVKISSGASYVPLPIGLVIGLLFASHDHFRIDRKIEYAVLIVAMLVGYFAPYGIYLSF